MKIRKALPQDIDNIMEIYAHARNYMAAHGNPTQWGKTKPPQSVIEDDISKGQCYAGIGEDNRIHFVFAFIPGNDSTYTVIENGCWLNNEPYSVLHRIASDGHMHGTLGECLAFCEKRCDNLRIDTHENNKTMQHLLAKYGFTRCGIIYLKDGAPRIAYQKKFS